MIDYIIPLPLGTMSGGKIADGLMACPGECGEVAVVRLMRTGEVAAYCDGRVTVRKCGARQFSGKARHFPDRVRENALARASRLGLSDAPQEFIDLFENSWGATLNEDTKAQDYEEDTPANTETVQSDPGTNPDSPAGETAENGDNSGISEPSTDEIHNSLYGG